MKQLWIESDRKPDGTAFTAREEANEESDADLYIRIDNRRDNVMGIVCDIDKKLIVHGWESFDHTGLGYCDDHVEIMN